jgi:hypothetical protein
MDFAEWLQKELNKRGWIQTDLIKQVKKAGYQLSSGHLSRIMTGHREANAEVCIRIAHGFGLSNEEVFRARGWLPATKSDIDPRTERVARRVSALPAQSREIALDAIEPVLESVYKLTQIREAPAEYKSS